jgi:hypothetical protein
MDLLEENDNLAGRYRLCQLGFALSGLALGLLSLATATRLAILLMGNLQLLWLFDNPVWDWGVNAPITLGSFLGSYLLWGRWREAAWQRRAGLLVLMNGIDVLFWAKDALLNYSDLLPGQNAPVSPHAWLQWMVMMGIGWSELILYAGLAADVSSQLGNAESRNTGRASQTLCTIGIALLMMVCLTQTDWDHWPLAPRRLTAAALMMRLGESFLLALAAFQITILCMSAARQCRRYVRELSHDDGHELLASRSDDPDWGQDRDRW